MSTREQRRTRGLPVDVISAAFWVTTASALATALFASDWWVWASFAVVGTAVAVAWWTRRHRSRFRVLFAITCGLFAVLIALLAGIPHSELTRVCAERRDWRANGASGLVIVGVLLAVRAAGHALPRRDNRGRSRSVRSTEGVGVEEPPEEAYERVTNPERFAPLIPAAEKLIADLERRFDVTVTRAPAAPWESSTVVPGESVRIVPTRADQAPLTITFTSLPGLYLEAGAWQRISLPACACDGCAEKVADVLRELAEYTDALTAGRLSERITGTVRPVLEHSWEGDGWGRSGKTPVRRSRAAELRAEALQPPADGRWRRWSAKPS